jgi:hypothetical protein
VETVQHGGKPADDHKVDFIVAQPLQKFARFPWENVPHDNLPPVKP